MKTNCVEIRHVCAAYADSAVLRDVSLTVAGGELLAVLGPSGSGKTTLLRVVAGLLAPATGQVFFSRTDITTVPAEARGAAMVFQKPLLFPYLTVAENVAFGLKMRGVAKAEIVRRVDEALEMVELSGYQRRRPSELSGGQEQRVSLARALVTRPNVLLLDEPFSALDTGLRLRMRRLVRELQQDLKLTTIFVTHDQEEAAFLADRVALLLDGGVEQQGPAAEVYGTPNSARAAAFLRWNIAEGQRS
jgi:ABC-type Fe3+/spermidine/putrescine transport system ATPase subunit